MERGGTGHTLHLYRQWSRASERVYCKYHACLAAQSFLVVVRFLFHSRSLFLPPAPSALSYTPTHTNTPTNVAEWLPRRRHAEAAHTRSSMSVSADCWSCNSGSVCCPSSGGFPASFASPCPNSFSSSAPKLAMQSHIFLMRSKCSGYCSCASCKIEMTIRSSVLKRVRLRVKSVFDCYVV